MKQETKQQLQQTKIAGGSLTDFLLTHAGEDPASFHMPGHKGRGIYQKYGYGPFLDRLMDCDITEIPGADNLFQAEEVIAQTMERYRRLYGVKRSYLLVNGSSGGLIAAILASVPRGGKLVMARNCHKSIFNALSLGDVTPVYAYPEQIEAYGILGAVSAAEVAQRLDENPDAAAVIIPSPNYYGICSNVAAIAEVVHQRGKVLIVDQAHGAHLKFFSKYMPGGLDSGAGLCFPPAAEEQGADLVIGSIHKTLASFTQTALLNVCSDRVDLYDLEDRLQAIESSSPSYPLMASLDINADLLERHGQTLVGDWAENLAWFYGAAPQAVPGLKVMLHPALDPTKLNLDMSAYGLNGNELEERLMKRGVFIELVTGNLVMAMTGIGNSRRDYERLLAALQEIAAEQTAAQAEIVAEQTATQKKREGKPAADLQEPAKNQPAGPDVPVQPAAVTRTLVLKEIPVRKERIPLSQAAGRICGSSVIPYPPGIPIVCPGEVFDSDVIEYIKARRAAGEKVIGLDDLGRVVVGR